MERHVLAIDLVGGLVKKLTERTRFGNPMFPTEEKQKWEHAPRRSEQPPLGHVIVPRQGAWARTLVTIDDRLYSVEIFVSPRTAYLQVWRRPDNAEALEEPAKDVCLGTARFGNSAGMYARLELLYALANGSVNDMDDMTRDMYLDFQYF